MRLKGLNEWAAVPSASMMVSPKGTFGRLDSERTEIERATLVFASACLIFASAVIVLMFALGN